MKDSLLNKMIFILFITCWSTAGMLIINFITKPDEVIIDPIYSIYTYDYNTTIVYRYMDNKLVYEYSYNGCHLVQIIEGSEQVTIIEFEDQDKAKEFCYSYLYNIQLEDRL